MPSGNLLASLTLQAEDAHLPCLGMLRQQADCHIMKDSNVKNV